MRKNVLLLFSKVPEAGLVKTRLTTLKDGVFAPEVASALYHCMLFDVAEICMAAFDLLEGGGAAASRHSARSSQGLSVAPFDLGSATPPPSSSTDAAAPTPSTLDTYELVISTPVGSADAMRALFADAGTWPQPIAVVEDAGATFDEHYNDAFQQCWDAGADCILSMGADMPALTVNDVTAGFDALHQLADADTPGIVLAPDQEMGVSVIGWTRQTADAPHAFNHTGVFYNADGLTVLPAYIQKARAANLAARYLPPIPDVDTMADLMHAITLVEALNYCAPFDGNTPPWRTAQALREMGWDEVRVPPNDLHDPREHIDS
ncbi:TIGR04282 family arsenosugar biosynthesis glycosyltransferase [Adlercreutzia murintestinalis]|uniref:TIGR04282 family arsenosugar biosynthesis glycosyltransferase n=1 Tax=Adlercreutzia murintestinalis TaxID=2941325 RepID=UPI002041F1D0|nr:DUF2064 domain-containing protein [Adlercreutzia murintestinalis]